MSNYIGSQFVNVLRRSLSGSTLFSQTSTMSPLMVDPTDIPGVARAWISFNGMQFANNRSCDIISKSTNVLSVSTTPGSTSIGDYTIDIKPGTFSNRDYTVVGSVEVNYSDPISAANTFFIKSSGTRLGGTNPTPNRLRIQTVNTCISSFNDISKQFAYASRINLIFYK